MEKGIPCNVIIRTSGKKCWSIRELNKELQNEFFKFRFKPVFSSLSPSEIKGLCSKAKEKEINFSRYFYSSFPPNASSGILFDYLTDNKKIELVYFENVPLVTQFVNPFQKSPFSTSQGYLYPQPCGIDAQFAWKLKGGNGKGQVKFVDIEQGWLDFHEDVSYSKLPKFGINDESTADHGIAVLGIVMMKNNDVGGVGIVPNANGFVISQWRKKGVFNTADAILTSISMMDFGDVLLVESQVNNELESEQLWPVEIQPAVFDAIKLATSLGIIVIIPAGNGDFEGNSGNNLDRFCHRHYGRMFKKNCPDFRDSGAIIVSAASSGLSHRRLEFSNYGGRVNCFAWGEDVLTAGLFPLSSGIAIDTHTDRFGGTSAAAAIISGVAIAIQSLMEAHGMPRLGPKEMRKILSAPSLGTSSANGKAIDKIGSMPDLRKIIESLIPEEKRILAS